MGSFLEIFIILFLLLISGLLCFSQSSILGGARRWIGLGAMLVTLALFGYGWREILDGSGAIHFFYYNWLGGDDSRINFGLVMEPLSQTIVMLAAFIGLVAILVQQRYPKQDEGRYLAGVLFCLAGLTVSWCALTTWTVLLGVFIVLLGNASILSSDSALEDKDANIVRSFMWQHMGGFILSLLGAGILAMKAPSVVMSGKVAEKNEALELLHYQDGDVRNGFILLLLGLFFHIRPFPFLSLANRESAVPQFSRLIGLQVFLAWSVFALIVKMEAELRNAGVFPTFGYLTSALTILGVICGLFQRDWQKSLFVWSSVSYSLALTVLIFSGKWPAAALMVSTGLSVVAMSLAGENVNDEGSLGKATAGQQNMAKLSIYLSTALGLGMYGFVSCGGVMNVLIAASLYTTTLVVAAFLFFLWTLLLWKVMNSMLSNSRGVVASWSDVLSPLGIAIAGLGIFWTGTWSGGIDAVERSDALPGMASFLDYLVGSPMGIWKESFSVEAANFLEHFYEAFWVQLAILTLSFLSAYWMRKRWERLAQHFPRFTDFWVQSGYFDDLVGSLRELGTKGVRGVESIVGAKTWLRWLPRGLGVALTTVGVQISRLDRFSSYLLESGSMRFFTLASRPLLRLQNDNLQWYLFFGLVVGLGMLMGFMTW